jgi:hypothetical protein
VHLYSIEEARALLPRLIPILVELRSLAAALRAHAESVTRHRRVVPGNGHLTTDAFVEGEDAAHEKANSRWRELTRELEELGVELKDPDTGLIDFYHERDGEVVYLCYRLDEADIDYWHTLDGGFAGRQRL